MITNISNEIALNVNEARQLATNGIRLYSNVENCMASIKTRRHKMTNLDPAENVRAFYRLQGAQQQIKFDLDIIGNYCLQNHFGQFCHCLGIVKAMQSAVILEWAQAQ